MRKAVCAAMHRRPFAVLVIEKGRCIHLNEADSAQQEKTWKKMEKGVDILAGVWYYTWAPRAAGKNDFLRRPEANGKNQWDSAEKRALRSTKTETLLKKVLDKKSLLW